MQAGLPRKALVEARRVVALVPHSASFSRSDQGLWWLQHVVQGCTYALPSGTRETGPTTRDTHMDASEGGASPWSSQDDVSPLLLAIDTDSGYRPLPPPDASCVVPIGRPLDDNGTATTLTPDATRLRWAVGPASQLVSVAPTYRMVVCIDVGPDMATMDPTSNSTLIDQAYEAVASVFTALIQPMQFSWKPVSAFQPRIMVSVMAHSSLQVDGFRLILHQAVLREDTLDANLATIRSGIRDFECLLARRRGVQQDAAGSHGPNMQTALQNLTTCMSLLPRDACPIGVLITNGVAPVADMGVFDNTIAQCCRGNIACHVIQVGSLTSNGPFGYVGRPDTLYHIAVATAGYYWTRTSLALACTRPASASARTPLRGNALQVSLLMRRIPHALSHSSGTGLQFESACMPHASFSPWLLPTATRQRTEVERANASMDPSQPQYHFHVTTQTPESDRTDEAVAAWYAAEGTMREVLVDSTMHMHQYMVVDHSFPWTGHAPPVPIMPLFEDSSSYNQYTLSADLWVLVEERMDQGFRLLNLSFAEVPNTRDAFANTGSHGGGHSGGDPGTDVSGVVGDAELEVTITLLLQWRPNIKVVYKLRTLVTVGGSRSMDTSTFNAGEEAGPSLGYTAPQQGTGVAALSYERSSTAGMMNRMVTAEIHVFGPHKFNLMFNKYLSTRRRRSQRSKVAACIEEELVDWLNALVRTDKRANVLVSQTSALFAPTVGGHPTQPSLTREQSESFWSAMRSLGSIPWQRFFGIRRFVLILLPDTDSFTRTSWISYASSTKFLIRCLSMWANVSQNNKMFLRLLPSSMGSRPTLSEMRSGKRRARRRRASNRLPDHQVAFYGTPLCLVRLMPASPSLLSLQVATFACSARQAIEIRQSLLDVLTTPDAAAHIVLLQRPVSLALFPHSGVAQSGKRRKRGVGAAAAAAAAVAAAATSGSDSDSTPVPATAKLRNAGRRLLRGFLLHQAWDWRLGPGFAVGSQIVTEISRHRLREGWVPVVHETHNVWFKELQLEPQDAGDATAQPLNCMLQYVVSFTTDPAHPGFGTLKAAVWMEPTVGVFRSGDNVYHMRAAFELLHQYLRQCDRLVASLWNSFSRLSHTCREASTLSVSIKASAEPVVTGSSGTASGPQDLPLHPELLVGVANVCLAQHVEGLDNVGEADPVMQERMAKVGRCLLRHSMLLATHQPVPATIKETDVTPSRCIESPMYFCTYLSPDRLLISELCQSEQPQLAASPSTEGQRELMSSSSSSYLCPGIRIMHYEVSKDNLSTGLHVSPSQHVKALLGMHHISETGGRTPDKLVPLLHETISSVWFHMQQSSDPLLVSVGDDQVHPRTASVLDLVQRCQTRNRVHLLYGSLRLGIAVERYDLVSALRSSVCMERARMLDLTQFLRLMKQAGKPLSWQRRQTPAAQHSEYGLIGPREQRLFDKVRERFAGVLSANFRRVEGTDYFFYCPGGVVPAAGDVDNADSDGSKSAAPLRSIGTCSLATDGGALALGDVHEAAASEAPGGGDGSDEGSFDTGPQVTVWDEGQLLRHMHPTEPAAHVVHDPPFFLRLEYVESSLGQQHHDGTVAVASDSSIGSVSSVTNLPVLADGQFGYAGRQVLKAKRSSASRDERKRQRRSRQRASTLRVMGTALAPCFVGNKGAGSKSVSGGMGDDSSNASEEGGSTFLLPIAEPAQTSLALRPKLERVLATVCDKIRSLLCEEILDVLRFMAPTPAGMDILMHNLRHCGTESVHHRVWQGNFVPQALDDEFQRVLRVAVATRSDLRQMGDRVFFVRESIPLGSDSESSDDEDQVLFHEEGADVNSDAPIAVPLWAVIDVTGMHTCDLWLFSRSLAKEQRDERVSDMLELLNGIAQEVNQRALLKHMHETKEASPLMCPSGDGSMSPMSASVSTLPKVSASASGSTAAPSAASTVSAGGGRRLAASSVLPLTSEHMAPGSLACDRKLVMRFPLHSRVNAQDALEAMRAKYQVLLVSNRKNLMVYADSEGSIFYIRMLCEEESMARMEPHDAAAAAAPPVADREAGEHESPLAMSPTEGELATGEPGERDADDAPESPSSSELERSGSTTKRSVIVLEVYGIDEPGHSITHEMRISVEDQLSMAALESICNSLRLNPNLRLGEADLEFIRPVDTKPTCRAVYSLPLLRVGSGRSMQSYLQVFAHSLGEFMTVLNTEERDDEDAETDTSLTQYSMLWNRIPDSTGPLRHRNAALAMVCVTVLDADGQPLPRDWASSRDKSHSRSEAEVVKSMNLSTLSSWAELCTQGIQVHDTIDAAVIGDPGGSSGDVLSVKIDLWTHGKLDLEDLRARIKSAMHGSLCIFVLESLFLSPNLTVAPTTVGDGVGDAIHAMRAIMVQGLRNKDPHIRAVHMKNLAMQSWQLDQFASVVAHCVRQQVTKAQASMFFASDTNRLLSDESPYDFTTPAPVYERVEPRNVPQYVSMEPESDEDCPINLVSSHVEPKVTLCNKGRCVFVISVNVPMLQSKRSRGTHRVSSEEDTTTGSHSLSAKDASRMAGPVARASPSGTIPAPSPMKRAAVVAEVGAHTSAGDASASLSANASIGVSRTRPPCVLAFVEDNRLQLLMYRMRPSAVDALAATLGRYISWNRLRNKLQGIMLRQKCGLFHAAYAVKPRPVRGQKLTQPTHVALRDRRSLSRSTVMLLSSADNAAGAPSTPDQGAAGRRSVRVRLFPPGSREEDRASGSAGSEASSSSTAAAAPTAGASSASSSSSSSGSSRQPHLSFANMGIVLWNSGPRPKGGGGSASGSSSSSDARRRRSTASSSSAHDSAMKQSVHSVAAKRMHQALAGLNFDNVLGNLPCSAHRLLRQRHGSVYIPPAVDNDPIVREGLRMRVLALAAEEERERRRERASVAVARRQVAELGSHGYGEVSVAAPMDECVTQAMRLVHNVRTPLFFNTMSLDRFDELRRISLSTPSTASRTHESGSLSLSPSLESVQRPIFGYGVPFEAQDRVWTRWMLQRWDRFFSQRMWRLCSLARVCFPPQDDPDATNETPGANSPAPKTPRTPQSTSESLRQWRGPGSLSPATGTSLTATATSLAASSSSWARMRNSLRAGVNSVSTSASPIHRRAGASAPHGALSQSVLPKPSEDTTVTYVAGNTPILMAYTPSEVPSYVLTKSLDGVVQATSAHSPDPSPLSPHAVSRRHRRIGGGGGGKVEEGEESMQEQQLNRHRAIVMDMLMPLSVSELRHMVRTWPSLARLLPAVDSGRLLARKNRLVTAIVDCLCGGKSSSACLRPSVAARLRLTLLRNRAGDDLVMPHDDEDVGDARDSDEGCVAMQMRFEAPCHVGVSVLKNAHLVDAQGMRKFSQYCCNIVAQGDLSAAVYDFHLDALVHVLSCSSCPPLVKRMGRSHVKNMQRLALLHPKKPPLKAQALVSQCSLSIVLPHLSPHVPLATSTSSSGQSFSDLNAYSVFRFMSDNAERYGFESLVSLNIDPGMVMKSEKLSRIVTQYTRNEGPDGRSIGSLAPSKVANKTALGDTMSHAPQRATSHPSVARSVPSDSTGALGEAHRYTVLVFFTQAPEASAPTPRGAAASVPLSFGNQPKAAASSGSSGEDGRMHLLLFVLRTPMDHLRRRNSSSGVDGQESSARRDTQRVVKVLQRHLEQTIHQAVSDYRRDMLWKRFTAKLASEPGRGHDSDGYDRSVSNAELKQFLRFVYLKPLFIPGFGVDVDALVPRLGGSIPLAAHGAAAGGIPIPYSLWANWVAYVRALYGPRVRIVHQRPEGVAQGSGAPSSWVDHMLIVPEHTPLSRHATVILSGAEDELEDLPEHFGADDAVETEDEDGVWASSVSPSSSVSSRRRRTSRRRFSERKAFNELPHQTRRNAFIAYQRYDGATGVLRLFVCRRDATVQVSAAGGAPTPTLLHGDGTVATEAGNAVHALTPEEELEEKKEVQLLVNRWIHFLWRVMLRKKL